MRVCIYTIGDQVNGFGHVMRSLVLAEQLQQRGAEVVLATPTATPGLARLRRSSFDLAEILTTSDGWALPEADLLVIDVEHGPRREFLESVRQNFKTLVTVCGSGYKVDDPAAVDELSDLIVEQNPFDVTHVMATEMLTGPQYIMIDPRYAELTADPEGPIVVSLGGADPYGCTQPIANALGAAGYGGVRVVIGPAAGMPDIRNGAPEIIHAPESLLSVLDGASALIGALGMTAYEAAAAGVPALLVSWTADHARTADLFAARGAAWSYGLAQNLSGAGITEMMGDIATLKKYRSHWNYRSVCARSFCDGQGAARVAERLLSIDGAEDARPKRKRKAGL